MPVSEGRIGARTATVLLLVEGYCSLAVEMIALRVLVPAAGQSIGVTSIVVTVFLAALAFGYRAGGRFDGAVREKVARNLAAAALWSAFWLSRFGLELAFDVSAWMPLLAQVAAYAAVGVAPAAYLLAQTVVLLVASGRDRHASGKAGGAFAASTLGNVTGGLVTALVAMQFLGVAAALVGTTVLLALGALGTWRRMTWRLCTAGVVVAVVGGGNLAVERGAYELSTAHADYAVERDGDGVRHLWVNGQHASREDGAGIGHPYIDDLPDQTDFLSAGLGIACMLSRHEDETRLVADMMPSGGRPADQPVCGRRCGPQAAVVYGLGDEAAQLRMETPGRVQEEPQRLGNGRPALEQVVQSRLAAVAGMRALYRLAELASGRPAGRGCGLRPTCRSDWPSRPARPHQQTDSRVGPAWRRR